MRGGRSFSRGGRGSSSYRGNSNSHYHTNSSYNSSRGGYDSGHSNGGRYRGGGSGGYSGRESYEPSFESRSSSGRYEGHSNSHRYPAERSNDFHKRQFHQSSRDRSLDRKRPRYTERKVRQGNDSTAASENECEVDLEQFMTVDSIGDVDDQNDNDEDQPEKKEENSTTEDIRPKTEINVGNEHVKKVEVYYCELCRYYLPLSDDEVTALSKHCGSRGHLRSYLRYKENQNLRLAAEKIHRRQERQEREAKKEKVAAKATKAELKQEPNDSIKENNDDENDDNVEDKIWADVDKDLGELLQEVGNIEENDNEDEDSTATERYDRFKNSVSETSDATKVDGIDETEKSTADNVVVASSTANGNADK